MLLKLPNKRAALSLTLLLSPLLVSTAAAQSSPSPQKVESPMSGPMNGSESPSKQVAVSASLHSFGSADRKTYSAELTIRIPEGLSASTSGVPGVIVQVDPPPGVKLVGKRIQSFEDQRDNEFLMEP